MRNPRWTSHTGGEINARREGEQLTGVRDNAYNLTSVLYHAAQGGTQYAKYIKDAEREGDQELADFFREVQQQDADRAKPARALLMDRQ
jgi:phage protein U